MQLIRLGVLALLAATCWNRLALAESAGWESLPNILAAIELPTFPDREFSIVDHGAVNGGETDCKPAIDAAIAACVEAGGGKVVVPAGEWRVDGPIHLRSNVNLHVARGATLKFSANPQHYLPAVFTRFVGTELLNYSPLVYALDQENIALTGEGTLDGQAGPGAWWPWKGKWGGEVDHGWRHATTKSARLRIASSCDSTATTRPQ
jgi:polygalacturonase